MSQEYWRDYWQRYDVDRLMVYRNSAWTWSVRPVQASLGAGVLSLNRFAAAYADVTSAEFAELADLLSAVEHTLKAVFDYTRVNYVSMMHHDHLVHLHCLPRYESPRSFGGREWRDATWPNPVNLGANRELSTPAVLDSLAEELRGKLRQ